MPEAGLVRLVCERMAEEQDDSALQIRGQAFLLCLVHRGAEELKV
jgi:hypothetical protein